MISTELAARLRDAGLVWRPADGDRFRIDAPELSDDVFTVSTMTIQAHEFPTGTILGFNGTTEWALDSVAIEDALWLPREDQLRDLLRSTFLGLRRTTRDDAQDGARDRYEVDVELLGERRTFADDDPAEAYGAALLALVELSS
ncbi:MULTISPECIES: pilus assembly protein CpaE [unclassified Isoptericola]|uniref:pilus assembly protein CpaE n=1 Tax=unclassified Isoptericola TaxID=2623355 RepID=UPI003650DF22